MPRLLSIAVMALALSVSAAGQAPGQTGRVVSDPQTGARSVTLFDAVVRIPPPLWLGSGDPDSQINVFTEKDRSSFVFEQIPKDQDFSSWAQLYAVRGLLVADTAAYPNALKFAEVSLLKPYEAACGGDNIGVQILESLETRFSAIFLCEDSPNGPPDIGYGPGVGEMQIYRAFKIESTFVEVFLKWRGDAFDRADKTSWPVSEAELNRSTQLLSTVEIVPIVAQ